MPKQLGGFSAIRTTIWARMKSIQALLVAALVAAVAFAALRSAHDAHAADFTLAAIGGSASLAPTAAIGEAIQQYADAPSLQSSSSGSLAAVSQPQVTALLSPTRAAGPWQAAAPPPSGIGCTAVSLLDDFNVTLSTSLKAPHAGGERSRRAIAWTVLGWLWRAAVNYWILPLVAFAAFSVGFGEMGKAKRRCRELQIELQAVALREAQMAQQRQQGQEAAQVLQAALAYRTRLEQEKQGLQLQLHRARVEAQTAQLQQAAAARANEQLRQEVEARDSTIGQLEGTVSALRLEVTGLRQQLVQQSQRVAVRERHVQLLLRHARLHPPAGNGNWWRIPEGCSTCGNMTSSIRCASFTCPGHCQGGQWCLVHRGHHA